MKKHCKTQKNQKNQRFFQLWQEACIDDRKSNLCFFFWFFCFCNTFSLFFWSAHGFFVFFLVLPNFFALGKFLILRHFVLGKSSHSVHRCNAQIEVYQGHAGCNAQIQGCKARIDCKIRTGCNAQIQWCKGNARINVRIINVKLVLGAMPKSVGAMPVLGAMPALIGHFGWS